MWAFLLLLAADPEFIRVDSGTLRLDDAAVRVGTFLISRTEVTQAEYRRVLSQTPALTAGADRPVERVTWFDATRYANRRSALEGLRPCYDALSRRVANCNGYRLPTGAEWTLAATPSEVTSAHLRAGGHQDIAELQGATRPVAAGRPNARGIHDLAGNVWEWCEDWYSPEPLLDSLRDPQGPATGVARLIRGGSFLSSRGAWNKSFVSSQAPDRASPFTGFRVVRQVAPAPLLPPPDAAWLKQFALPATAQTVPPVDPAQLPAIRRAWSETLGLLPSATSVPLAKPLRQLRESTWNGTLLDLEVEPGWPARVLLMEPVRKPAGRLPVVIVPYYDVDSPAGANLGGRRAGGGVRAFARLAVERGCLAVAIRWFGEGDGEGYDEAVWQLVRRHPGLTGLGKVVYDTRRLIDYLVTRPDVDPRRIGIIGHSLGGKMALYAAAFEPRLAAVVASEPGIGLNLSNYEAFWYLGRRRPDSRDQQELLALIAPRPFLLIAGESSDGQKSAAFLRAAQPAYRALGNPAHLALLNHRQGHSPTPASVTVAMDWLERFLF